MFADIRSAMSSELFMEFGNAESRDEATGLISGCSERGECLIYSEAGDIVGRSCSIGHCAQTARNIRNIRVCTRHTSYRPSLPPLHCYSSGRPAPRVCALHISFAPGQGMEDVLLLAMPPSD